MEEKEANINVTPEKKEKTPSPEPTNAESSRRANRMRGSEIMDATQMEKFISLLNFKNKESDELLKIALKILKYRSKQKNNDLTLLELEALQNATKNMEFFQTMNKRPINVSLNLHQRCCRAMNYLFMPKGSVVFEKGDPSDKLYIILTGAVNIFAVKSQDQIRKEYEWMDKVSAKSPGNKTKEHEIGTRRAGLSVGKNPFSVLKKVEEGARVKVQQKEYNVKRARKNLFKPKDLSDSSMSDKSESILQIESRSSSNSENDNDSNSDDSDSGSGSDEEEQGKKVSSKLLKKLFGDIEPDAIQNLDKFFTNGVCHLIYETTLGAGLLFGELGLLKNKTRQRTIICKEDTEFATITKADFLELMHMVKERKRREKIYFVEKSLFPEFVFDINARYAELMKKQIVVKGQKIYQDREKPEKMYLIREGEVTLYARKGRPDKETEQDWANYQEYFDLMRKDDHDSMKLIPVAILSAGQYFGEEDLIDNQPRTLTAICTSTGAKLYALRYADLKKCMEDYPATKEVLVKRLNKKLKQRFDFKKRNVEVPTKIKKVQMAAVRLGSQYYEIRQNIKEIFSEDNKKFITLRMAEQKEAEKQKRNLGKRHSIIEEPQDKAQGHSSDPSMINKPERSPAISRKTSGLHPKGLEPVVEYHNKPNAVNPEMTFKHFGKNEEDLRTLLLRGIRSDVALMRKKKNTDEISKMTDIVESNSKTVDYLCKISPPISDLFPMLKEFTTKENERKQRRRERVREIERLRQETSGDQLPKLNNDDSVNIHMKKKRLQRSESFKRGIKDRSIDRSGFANLSMINPGQRGDLHSFHANVSEISALPDHRSQKESFLSGNRLLFRGNSIAESGFSSIETNQDIRYYSTIEMQHERKDLPTKVNFSLNLKSIEDKKDFESLFSGREHSVTEMDKPPESSRAVLEYRESQKRKNNSSFVLKYKQRSLSNLLEADKTRLQKSTGSRYL